MLIKLLTEKHDQYGLGSAKPGEYEVMFGIEKATKSRSEVEVVRFGGITIDKKEFALMIDNKEMEVVHQDARLLTETKEEVMERIYPALIGVMESIGAIGKTRKNPQQGYNFRGIDDVYNNLQPALIKHKVLIIPRLTEIEREERETKSGGSITYTHVKGSYDFISAEDGSKVTAETYGEGMDTSDKSTNKAMSAALKYAIIQTLAIPTEELIDSERDHIEPAAKQNAPAKATTQWATKADGAALVEKGRQKFKDASDDEIKAWVAEIAARNRKGEKLTKAEFETLMKNWDNAVDEWEKASLLGVA